MNLDQLYQASFKGVRFLTVGEITTEGGRKISVNEYPKGNERFIEDLGLLEKSFRDTAHLEFPGKTEE